MKYLILSFVLLCSAVHAEVPLISAVGYAEKAVDPNMVRLNIEIWSKAGQAKIAQESVAKEYQRIKALLDKFKIKKEDFETQSYNLSPEYNYDKGQQKITGYRATHGILLTLRKIDEVGQLVDALASSMKAESGGVNLHSLVWDYDKRDQIEMGLLADAVKNSRMQADELAKASNSKIKGVFRLSRETGGNPGVARMKLMESADMASSSSEMSAGPIKIKVQVQADYQIQ